MPGLVLDCPGVLTVVGQLEAGGMPEHVGMHGEVGAGHLPARATTFRKPESVSGPFRSVTKTQGVAGYSRASFRSARISGPRSGWVLGEPFLRRRTWCTPCFRSTCSQFGLAIEAIQNMAFSAIGVLAADVGVADRVRGT